MSRRINSTGRRRSVAAPAEERLERSCPHLAFIEPGRFDRVQRLLDERNAKFRVGKNGFDPRTDRPKKRTRWPGQHLDCGICGRPLRYGAHGQNEHLFCSGAAEYHCWQAISADGPLSARKLSEAIRREITSLPEFEEAFLSKLEAQMARIHENRDAKLQELDRIEQTLSRQQKNILDSLRDAGPLPSLLQDLKGLEARLEEVASGREKLAHASSAKFQLPPMDEIKAQLLSSFETLALESPEFARWIHRLIPRITVWPVRLCDGGHIGLRARFTLHLLNAVPEARRVTGLADVLKRPMVVDLFDPPQREAFRPQVMQLKAREISGRRMTERQIAKDLTITLPAVQRACALARKMEEQGLSDAYLPVAEPPEDYGKLRRHKHPRFRFEPLPGPES